MLTGAILEYLWKTTKTYGIVRTYNLQDDPNYVNTGVSLSYKEEILKIIKENDIKLLIDIHGCKNTHGFDIEIGTNHLKNVNENKKQLDILINKFKQLGIVAIDRKFTAGWEGKVSSFINKKSKIPCIQIEISKDYRNLDTIEKLLKTFEEAIKEIYKEIYE